MTLVDLGLRSDVGLPMGGRIATDSVSCSKQSDLTLVLRSRGNWCRAAIEALGAYSLVNFSSGHFLERESSHP